MTTKPKILVTAAGGNTGRQTTLALLEQGYPVRAFVHRDDGRAEYLRRHGAEVVVGTLTDMGDLRAALDGVRRAYFVAPSMPGAARRRHAVRRRCRGIRARGRRVA